MESLFDTVAGLPVHPLVVHAAVVLLPMCSLGLLLSMVRPTWRERYAGLLVLGLIAGAVAAFVSSQSGEALAERIGEPEFHAEWGERLTLIAVVLAVSALLWWLFGRRRPTALSRIFGLVAAVLALGVLALTVVVGHSGAQAAWGGRLEASAKQPGATPEPVATAEPSADPSPAALSLAEVAKHDTTADCWTAIDGEVYDLTQWVNTHPGGADAIGSLCGIEGSSAFRNQHGSNPEVMSRLAGFKIGALG